MAAMADILVIAGVFLFTGFIKGVVGVGLPTVSLALLATIYGLAEGMVLMLVPAFVTNLWQAVVGGYLGASLRRFWHLLLLGALGTWFAAGVLAGADRLLLSGLLGIVLLIYSVFSLMTPPLPQPGRHERWLSPMVGAVGGIMTGLTGSFVVPGALYVQALGLPRDFLVQALGLCFTVFSLSLALGLGGHGLLPVNLGLMSLLGVPPALLGMLIGQRTRRHIPEDRFRRVFFAALSVLGCYLAARAFA